MMMFPIFSERRDCMSYRKRLSILIAVDLLIIWFSVYSSYYLKFTGHIASSSWEQLILYGIVSSFVCLGCMIYFKMYNRIWQYASIGEILSVLKAVLIGSLLAYGLTYVIGGQRVPISIGIRTFETMLLLMGGARFIWRIYRDNYMKKNKSQQRALIVGAGDCGTMIAKELKYNSASKLYPVAFIDDDPAKHKMQVYGVTVVGNRNDIVKIVKKQHISDIIIAIPSASRDDISKIIDICKEAKVSLQIIPRINDIIDGKVTLNEIRNVEVEDLLGREPIKVDLERIASYVENQTVLVTGAGGSIGSELCRQISHYSPRKLLLLDHSENYMYQIEKELRNIHPELQLETLIADIKDLHRIDDIFKKYKPEVVFHAAAHKHVPLMERNPSEAIKNNVFGTKHVAMCADRYGAERFVLISTDKAVNPTSIMGATKRIAELIIQGIGETSTTKFAAVRFGNVLGSNGSVIPHFKEQIASGGPVTVTSPDMIRYFMTIPEAVELVIQAGAYAEKNDIFILDMGEPVRILELAEDLIRLSGYEPYEEIDIVFTGLRPGEKLFEELFTSDEDLTTTLHGRIFTARTTHYASHELEPKLARLERVLAEGKDQMIAAVKAIVKEYVSDEVLAQKSVKVEAPSQTVDMEKFVGV